MYHREDGELCREGPVGFERVQTGRGYVPGPRAREAPSPVTGKFQGLIDGSCSGMSPLENGASCRAGVERNGREKRAAVGDEPCVGRALSWDPKLRGSELAQDLGAGFARHQAPSVALSPKPLPADLLLPSFSQR